MARSKKLNKCLGLEWNFLALLENNVEVLNNYLVNTSCLELRLFCMH